MRAKVGSYVSSECCSSLSETLETPSGVECEVMKVERGKAVLLPPIESAPTRSDIAVFTHPRARDRKLSTGRSTGVDSRYNAANAMQQQGV